MITVITIFLPEVVPLADEDRLQIALAQTLSKQNFFVQSISFQSTMTATVNFLLEKLKTNILIHIQQKNALPGLKISTKQTDIDL